MIIQYYILVGTEIRSLVFVVFWPVSYIGRSIF